VFDALQTPHKPGEYACGGMWLEYAKRLAKDTNTHAEPASNPNHSEIGMAELLVCMHPRL
jgi:hypothetical protein